MTETLAQRGTRLYRALTKLEDTAPVAYAELAATMNLGVPLVTALYYELVTGLTDAGKESVAELEAALAKAIKNVTYTIECDTNGPGNDPYRTGRYGSREAAQKHADELNAGAGCSAVHKVVERS